MTLSCASVSLFDRTTLISFAIARTLKFWPIWKPAEALWANGRADFYVSNQDIRIFAQLWVIGKDFCVSVPILSDSCKTVVQKL